MNAGTTTRKSYERRPYPGVDRVDLVAKGGALPPLEWVNAIGRPGRAAPGRILVAGCGMGVEAFVLRDRWPEAEIVAVDFSPRSIAQAVRLQRSARDAKPIRFIVADLTDPDLAAKIGGNFDLITCHGVLSYIPEPDRILRSFASCLARDGALYLGVNGASHTATGLRPWLVSLGFDVAELRGERRLRELLALWDSLHDDEVRHLADMPASYLAGDICGPHFNNWPLRRWATEAAKDGWEVVGTWLLPLAFRLTMEGGRDRLLFPAAVPELAARLDDARPAGFHRLLLRRQSARSGAAPRWTGLYDVRFKKGPDDRTTTAFLRSSTLGLRLEFMLGPEQTKALMALIDSKVVSVAWLKRWGRGVEAKRLLWRWKALGAVVDCADAG